MSFSSNGKCYYASSKQNGCNVFALIFGGNIKDVYGPTIMYIRKCIRIATDPYSHLPADINTCVDT